MSQQLQNLTNFAQKNAGVLADVTLWTHFAANNMVGSGNDLRVLAGSLAHAVLSYKASQPNSGVPKAYDLIIPSLILGLDGNRFENMGAALGPLGLPAAHVAIHALEEKVINQASGKMKKYIGLASLGLLGLNLAMFF